MSSSGSSSGIESQSQSSPGSSVASTVTGVTLHQSEEILSQGDSTISRPNSEPDLSGILPSVRPITPRDDENCSTVQFAEFSQDFHTSNEQRVGNCFLSKSAFNLRNSIETRNNIENEEISLLDAELHACIDLLSTHKKANARQKPLNSGGVIDGIARVLSLEARL